MPHVCHSVWCHPPPSNTAYTILQEWQCCHAQPCTWLCSETTHKQARRFRRTQTHKPKCSPRLCLTHSTEGIESQCNSLQEQCKSRLLHCACLANTHTRQPYKPIVALHRPTHGQPQLDTPLHNTKQPDPQPSGPATNIRAAGGYERHSHPCRAGLGSQRKAWALVAHEAVHKPAPTQ